MNIFSLTTNKLVEHLRTGQISSVEVCTQYIERIEKFEKDINAWEYFDKKKLLEKAEDPSDDVNYWTARRSDMFYFFS